MLATAVATSLTFAILAMNIIAAFFILTRW
jgi:hypothetical protein